LSFFVQELSSKLERIEFLAQSGVFELLQLNDKSFRPPLDELYLKADQIGMKSLAINAAEGDLHNARQYYENWDIEELFEWFATKLAINYRDTDYGGNVQNTYD
jgi:hypothetical protein